LAELRGSPRLRKSARARKSLASECVLSASGETGLFQHFTGSVFLAIWLAIFVGLDEAFSDAIDRLGDDPSSTVCGDVEWFGDGNTGVSRLVPVTEDGEPVLPDFVYEMFGDYEA
jgi:hypothetical protein